MTRSRCRSTFLAIALMLGGCNAGPGQGAKDSRRPIVTGDFRVTFRAFYDAQGHLTEVRYQVVRGRPIFERGDMKELLLQKVPPTGTPSTLLIGTLWPDHFNVEGIPGPKPPQ